MSEEPYRQAGCNDMFVLQGCAGIFLHVRQPQPSGKIQVRYIKVGIKPQEDRKLIHFEILGQ